MKKNKELLKISNKNLPQTANITKWGEIQIIKGEYPYKFNLKETRVLISSNNINISEGINYIVLIRGFKFKYKKIILHRVSVTDKTFKFIHLNFIDIIYELNNYDSFVRLIENNQYVYEKGNKVLTQKRKKKLNILLIYQDVKV